MKSTVDRLREKALQLLLENLALTFAISPAGREGRLMEEQNRARILSSSKQELQNYIGGVEKEIKDLRRKYGVKASSSELIAFLEFGKAAPPGQVILPRVVDVCKFFHDYSKVFSNSKYLPAHARILFDYHGNGPNGEPDTGIRLLEASIYEDMAALWNILDNRATDDNLKRTPRERKTQYALCRATVSAAVYFTEAYLNGLAFDFLADPNSTFTNEEKSVLSDWNFEKMQPRYLSLKDKILKFQRIINRTEHAPIQPTNTPSMKKVLDLAECFRNSLAHPAPHFNPKSGSQEKELAIYNISTEHARNAVDSAVDLSMKLEELFHGNYCRIPWLLPRTPAGPFPEEAFN